MVSQMRVPIAAGNWKMNKTVKEASAFAEAFPGDASFGEVEVIICPPFTALVALASAWQQTPVKLGAQNMHWELKGAFTGEISPLMLSELGCEYVILGHSERRHIFGEKSEAIGKKVHTAFCQNLKPILCVGETIEERESGKTKETIKEQLLLGVELLESEQTKNLVIAYEPVWAIGTGKAATPEDALEVITFIREELKNKFGEEASELIRILYGGSVSPDNIYDFVNHPQIDGTLVGGASLDPTKFGKIVVQTEKAKT